jgi:replicative DNA helicase
VTHDEFEPGGQRVTQPPANIPAEMSTLGSMLRSRDAIADVTEVIKNPADFFRPAHQTIFQLIVARYNDGAPVDPIVINDDLTKSGDINRVGGVGYVYTLTQAVDTVGSAEYHAGLVRE